jgi:hypothetical protein
VHDIPTLTPNLTTIIDNDAWAVECKLLFEGALMSAPIHCESLHAKSPCLLKLLNAIGKLKACKALIGKIYFSRYFVTTQIWLAQSKCASMRIWLCNPNCCNVGSE